MEFKITGIIHDRAGRARFFRRPREFEKRIFLEAGEFTPGNLHGGGKSGQSVGYQKSGFG